MIKQTTFRPAFYLRNRHFQTILPNVIHPSHPKLEKQRLELDDHFTAPVHGFDSANHYSEKSSSRQFLVNINKPTLIIHAKDDPFMTADVLPEAGELSASVTL